MDLNKILYHIIYGLIWLFALLPFRVVYLLSDVLYVFLYRVLRYRRRVVRENLTNSFPEKPEKEIRAIEKKFYHYISDYILENLKTVRMSRESLLRHLKFLNPELFLRLLDEKGSVILMLPHYANFEWVMGIRLIMRADTPAVQVYKPLRNKALDLVEKKIRSRFGGYNIPKHNTLREIVKLRRRGVMFGLGLIADQSPNVNSLNVWTDFLNQDTAFMDGGERISKMLGSPVFYCDLRRVRRGYTEAEFLLMTDDPKSTAEGEITKMFAQRLEQTIRREPAYWFWSHRRWKHKRL